MTWLAPWALGAGAVGMLGVIAAHLLTRQRPRALALATARFLPAGMLESTTLQRVPMDRWWMALRLLVLALLTLGVAQPVASVRRVPTRTVLLLDRSLPLIAQQKALATLGEADAVIAFDTNAVTAHPTDVAPRVARLAHLSAAFATLAHARDSLARGTAQLRVAIASRFSLRSLDPATQSLRALLPDSIAVLPITLPTDLVVQRGAVVVHADVDDQIAATARLLGDSIARLGTIVERRAALTPDDSAAAIAGATVLWWPAGVAADTAALQALTVATTTWITPMSSDSVLVSQTGRAVGWWADGAVAMRETSLGAGCVLETHVGLPSAGDHALSLSAQAWLAAVLTSCDADPMRVLAPPAWLRSPHARRGTGQARPVEMSAAAPWLLGAALALALAELLLRRRSAP